MGQCHASSFSADPTAFADHDHGVKNQAPSSPTSQRKNSIATASTTEASTTDNHHPTSLLEPMSSRRFRRYYAASKDQEAIVTTSWCQLSTSLRTNNNNNSTHHPPDTKQPTTMNRRGSMDHVPLLPCLQGSEWGEISTSFSELVVDDTSFGNLESMDDDDDDDDDSMTLERRQELMMSTSWTEVSTSLDTMNVGGSPTRYYSERQQDTMENTSSGLTTILDEMEESMSHSIVG